MLADDLECVHRIVVEAQSDFGLTGLAESHEALDFAVEVLDATGGGQAFAEAVAHLLRHALDVAGMRAQLKIPPTSPVILFLGGISKEKGTDTILQAFEKLLKRQPNSYLIIAGAHPYEHDTRFALHYILSPSARYLEQIRTISKRLGNHVIYTGPSRKIPSLIALSTVVVFPASVGHFARPIIEAACMAKPVIASALPPLQELVIDQTTGYLLPPHDIDAWTDHLEKIIIHPSLATKLGNHAYHLSTRYHSDIYAKKISTIYKTILKGTHE